MISASIQGILVTIILLGILIAIHEAGHFLAAKSLKIPVRQFAIGFGPRIFGFQWGETECRLNWIPLGGYCAFEDDMGENKEEGSGGVNSEQAERLMRNRPIWQRTWVVSAGVIFNFVSAWLILWFSIMAMGVAPTGRQLVSVQATLPGTPAASAGLMAGDRITEIENQTFRNFTEFQTTLGQHAGKPITVDVLRGGEPVELAVTPTEKGTLGFQAQVENETEKIGNPLVAMVAATQNQYRITTDLWHALGAIFQKPNEMMSQTGGPIAIVAMGDQLFQHDPWKLIDFAVLLSIELAIINILPLPALDGGHLVLLAIEKLRGKPLPRRIEESVLVAGFVLIMGLGMLLIMKDIFTVPGMYQERPAVTEPAAPAGK